MTEIFQQHVAEAAKQLEIIGVGPLVDFSPAKDLEESKEGLSPKVLETGGNT
jgi:hypothetical protein